MFPGSELAAFYEKDRPTYPKEFEDVSWREGKQLCLKLWCEN